MCYDKYIETEKRKSEDESMFCSTIKISPSTNKKSNRYTYSYKSIHTEKIDKNIMR